MNFKNENVFFTPSQISAMILSKVKWFVEKKESTNIMDCVIAIPASFDENARAEVRISSMISNCSAC